MTTKKQRAPITFDGGSDSARLHVRKKDAGEKAPGLEKSYVCLYPARMSFVVSILLEGSMRKISDLMPGWMVGHLHKTKVD